ncbi:MAG: hypothetical protein JW904_02440 [Spirochaetales bacterium]|nr:hypothetical protein [Spirochaetales bacterium]
MENASNSNENSTVKIYQRKEFIPVVVFGTIFLVLLFSTALSGHPPNINSMNQDHNLTYEVITLEGQNFGEPDNGGEVRIGDLILAPSNFSKWSDNKIVINLPREVPSGVISVITKNGRCSGEIYINPEEVPRIASYVDPLIREVVPAVTAVGSLVNITGERFGQEQGESRVFFTWIEENRSRSETGNITDPVVYARDRDLDYVFWSDNKIQLRVPDGIQTGKIALVTMAGMSNFKYIDLQTRFGEKEYYDRNKYPLRLSFTVSGTVQPDSDPFFVWFPVPAEWPELRGVQLYNTSINMDADRVEGAARIDLNTSLMTKPLSISADCIFDLYAIKTEIDIHLVEPFQDTKSDFYKKFTESDHWIRPADPFIQALHYKYFKKEPNPFIYARMLYDKMREEFSFEEVTADSFDGIRQYMAKKSGNAKVYAVTYCSLLRAAGIPSRIVGGYIIDSSRKLLPHYWTEFFIEKIGWVPVDPYLGDEQLNSSFVKGDDFHNFYFGNLDNRHIPLAKGLTELPRLITNSKIIGNEKIPAFFSHIAEIPFTVESLSIEWDDPQLIGIY